MKQKSTLTKKNRSYNQMLNEVEKIIDNISDQECDLDTMVENVENGYKLISQLRERLTQTKERIEKLQKEFEHNENSST